MSQNQKYVESNMNSWRKIFSKYGLGNIRIEDSDKGQAWLTGENDSGTLSILLSGDFIRKAAMIENGQSHVIRNPGRQGVMSLLARMMPASPLPIAKQY